MPSKHGPKVDAFYHSQEWKAARALKIKLSHGLCENCGRKGTEIHHVTPLSEDNLGDPAIRIGMGNLMLLCKACHDAMRSQPSGNRCSFDKEGNVVSIEAKAPPGGGPLR